MANKELSSLAVSVFCENMAMMTAAGIGAEEAAGLLCDDSSNNDFHDAAKSVQKHLLLQGGTLGDAVRESGYFPEYVSRMIAAGEKAGRTEQTLRSLAGYYARQNELESQLKSAVLYPAVLLLLMTGILAVLLAKVLPVFTGVYTSLTGDLTTSSYGYITAAYATGTVALLLTGVLALAVLAVALMQRSASGRRRLGLLAQKLPMTKGISAQLALSHFTEVLVIFIASGVDVDAAMEAAAQLVQDQSVLQRVKACQTQMKEKNAGLATAIYDQNLFEPLYGRMLVSGARSGNLEGVLSRLAELFSADAQTRIHNALDRIEPAVTAFLTVAVGITLVSAMLPLVGILGSIG